MLMQFKRYSRNLSILIFVLSMAACGGGGSGGGGGGAPNTDASVSSFTSTSTTITAGSSVNLTAVFTDGTGVINNSVGSVTSNTPVSVTPASTTTFMLTVTNTAGAAVTSTVTVTVVPASSITSFVTSAATIEAGSSVDLTAAFTGGTGIIDSGIGSVTSNTPVSVTPASTTTYLLTVTNTAGAAVTSTVTVTVVPTPSITKFVTAAATITAGSSVDLTAAFSGGTGVIDSSVGSVTSNTPVSVTPTSTTTYTLTVTNAIGTAVTSTATITVVKIDSISLTVGDLDQVFQSDQTAYTATVEFLATSINVQAATVDAGTTTKVNNVAVDSNNLSQSIALSEGANAEINITVTKNAVTATYSLTITRQSSATLAEEALIRATTPGAGDESGYNSVSISGDTLAVGAYGADSRTGAVYIYTRSGSTWTQQAKLSASDGVVNDQFGWSVSLSGDTLAVGAYGAALFTGAVYIYTRSGSTWVQNQKLSASDGQRGDRLGWSISLSGDTLAVGASQENTAGTSAGAAYVFSLVSSVWVESKILRASDGVAGDYFGYSVSLSGDTLAVGAYLGDTVGVGAGSDTGAVYIFTEVSPSVWPATETQKLSASNAGPADGFGYSVSLSGDTLVVGATEEDMGAITNAGAAYIFTRKGSWLEFQILHASDAAANDRFGWSVSLSGDTLAVGAPLEDGGPLALSLAGAAYVFTRNGLWAENMILHASDTEAVDKFGSSVSLSGDTLVVGAPFEDAGALAIMNAGTAYTFK